MEDKQSNLRITILVACAFLLMIAATVLLWPLISKLAEPEGQQAFRAWVDSVGVSGWFIVLGIQILQIIVAFIPGEPVEILAGVLFGAWGGLLLCIVGSVLATTVVFVIMRKFGLPLLYRLFDKDKVDNFKFFRDSQRVETAAFILFLIPGTPKDMLTYVAGVSKIKTSRFLIITTFARIPSIITGTIAGDVMLDDWKLALGIFLLTGIIGIIGIRYKERIISHARNISKRKELLNGNDRDR